jgi:hypothetical protein
MKFRVMEEKKHTPQVLYETISTPIPTTDITRPKPPAITTNITNVAQIDLHYL